jgi:hypothetical protein
MHDGRNVSANAFHWKPQSMKQFLLKSVVIEYPDRNTLSVALLFASTFFSELWKRIFF